jgi:Na+-translocating ferredoxin:NAD+ oxidoreductase RnfD subunit
MLKSSVAPHLRRTERPFYQAGGVLLCLVPLVAFSCLYYGVRPALLVGIGALSAVLVEILCQLFRHRRPAVADGTSAVTGALIGSMMSPLTPFWVPAMGAAFAIGVAKMPFGGTGRNLFNPAAAGMAFCAICFPTRLFVYPDPSLQQPLPLGDTSAVITALSPAAQLANSGSSSFGWFSLLSGNFPGPIGSAGIVVLVACALYLYVRGSASPLITLPYLATCGVIAALFPRAAITPSSSVMLELCTGLLLFTGVFLLCDPVTAPRHWLGRVAYGCIAGILVMLLRYHGRFECCEFFAVLLVNSLSPVLDRTCWQLSRSLSEVMKK